MAFLQAARLWEEAGKRRIAAATFEGQQRVQEINRLQKVLEGANLKLAAVATNVLGKNG